MLIALLFFTINLHAQVRVNTNGDVAIGSTSVTPGAKLHVEGSVRFSNWTDIILDWNSSGHPTLYPERNSYFKLGKSYRWLNHIWCYNIDYQTITQGSDIRLKDSINSLTNVLPRLNELNTYSYYFKDSFFKEFSKEELKKQKRKEFGFIAQEMEGIFPELVHKKKQDDTGEEYLSINYVGMVPILAQAIKEQQAQINTLQELVQTQAKALENLDKKYTDLVEKNKLKSAATLDISNTEEEFKNSTLLQNQPNPFDQDTEVNFFISENINNARLVVYDINGAEIKSFPVTANGHNSIFINGRELNAGVYIYRLINDNKVIDSKRMIITD